MPFKSPLYRPILYGLTYVALGLAGFALPTQNWYEILVRGVFIALGLGMLLTAKHPRITINFLVAGITILSFWIFFASVEIIGHWDDPFYRIHFFTLPLWFSFALGHYAVIKEISQRGR